MPHAGGFVSIAAKCKHYLVKTRRSVQSRKNKAKHEQTKALHRKCIQPTKPEIMIANLHFYIESEHE